MDGLVQADVGLAETDLPGQIENGDRSRSTRSDI
jgi:hypothetical protein